MSLGNKKKFATNSLRNVLKRKNKVEEGGASCSRVKRNRKTHI
jgi:hypothetical protein